MADKSISPDPNEESAMKVIFELWALEKYYSGFPLTTEEREVIKGIAKIFAKDKERRAKRELEGMLSGRISSCNERRGDEYWL